MQIQKIELENAKAELEKVGEKEDVYKVVGPLLVKGTRSELKKEIEEKLETMEMRAKSAEKQEEKLKGKLKENQQKLQDIFKGLAPEDNHRHGPDSEGMGAEAE
jgi:prefoldin beta subunit